MLIRRPSTGKASPEISHHITQQHESNSGIYTAVVVKGMLKAGDVVKLTPSIDNLKALI